MNKNCHQLGNIVHVPPVTAVEGKCILVILEEES